MRGVSSLALIALALAVGHGFFACNSIVGVEDVTLATDSKDAGKRRPPPPDDDPPPAPPPPPPSGPRDSGTTGGCNGAPACKRFVFATRAAFNGNLGGIAGADQKCADAAKTVPALAGRTFKAWLSDGQTAATSRLPHGTDVYQRVDKTAIASSFDDLVDGNLAIGVDLDETGALIPSGDLERSVWTGTTFDGLTDTQNFHCANWTSSSVDDTGLFGDAHELTASWTQFTTSSCNGEYHLYCIEF